VSRVGSLSRRKRGAAGCAAEEDEVGAAEVGTGLVFAVVLAVGLVVLAELGPLAVEDDDDDDDDVEIGEEDVEDVEVAVVEVVEGVEVVEVVAVDTVEADEDEEAGAVGVLSACASMFVLACASEVLRWSKGAKGLSR
jgi:hypothetical protein